MILHSGLALQILMSLLLQLDYELMKIKSQKWIKQLARVNHLIYRISIQDVFLITITVCVIFNIHKWSECLGCPQGIILIHWQKWVVLLMLWLNGLICLLDRVNCCYRSYFLQRGHSWNRRYVCPFFSPYRDLLSCFFSYYILQRIYDLFFSTFQCR